MDDRTLMERVVALEQQVLAVENMLFVITEVLEDQGITSKADLNSRSEKIRKDRER